MLTMSQTRSRLTPQQIEIEKEAVRLLTQAQELLKEDDHNVDEAQHLRFQVIQKLLPGNRMYIVGKHPQSLLRDVNRRIQHAYFRLAREKIGQSMVVDPVILPVLKPRHGKRFRVEKNDEIIFLGERPNYKEIDQGIQSRYSKATSSGKKHTYNCAIWFLLLTLSFSLFVFVMRSMYGSSALNQSFQWLAP